MKQESDVSHVIVITYWKSVS